MGLRYAPDVQDFVRTLSPRAKKAIREATDLLAKDPYHPNLDIKVLRKQGADRFIRARVAKDYRIVYTPRPGYTYIWRIMHRSEGYDWLEKLDSSGH
jgi:mRNA-degrading endonuclease RelE of RelBE toxin-antitoxin system